ncbi:MAG TPA: lysophospholipid acyltransferase family protein [Gemmatimonadales bacterium]|jgi:1-acyl-sn-glycerol-3-phosphate acyltransferase
MWLLPVFSFAGRLAGSIYYRLTVGGQTVPGRGPVLLVANHPNSLLDPVLVIAASRRKVRFLAKATLFTDSKVGWLVRGSGAIPVYRRADDPRQMARNEEMFQAVHQALAGGAAVGIFPEGLSHSEPSLAPLKTGAARIALGAARRLDRSFPVVPVGLVFRSKDVFRSEAQVVIGPPIAWDDLASRDADDARSVRELTDRIATALRRVTVNLDEWEDRPIVESALEVWESEFGGTGDPSERIARTAETTRILHALRARPDGAHHALIEAVRQHAIRLHRLRLGPRDLARDTTAGAAVRWSARRLAIVSLPAVLIAVASYLMFWVPYTITGRVAARMQPDTDQRSTYKLMVGTAVYGIWLAALASIGAFVIHPLAFPVIALGVPALGMLGLRIRERWRGAWADARSFLFLRTRRKAVLALQEKQRQLAQRLDQVYRLQASPDTPP